MGMPRSLREGAVVGCFGPKGGKMKLLDNAVLLDVRQADEFNAGHIDGAVSSLSHGKR